MLAVLLLSIEPPLSCESVIHKRHIYCIIITTLGASMRLAGTQRDRSTALSPHTETPPPASPSDHTHYDHQK